MIEKEYKGGLHIHTTVTDGRRSPADTMAAYKAAGYDFIALTDHWKYGEPCDYEGMTVLSGIEYDVGTNIGEAIFHIVGVGMERDPGLKREDLSDISGSTAKAQKCIDAINECGGAAILAHPAWSLDRPCDMAVLRGLAGVEVYNAVSGILPYGDRADSSSLLDVLAADNIFLPLHAADDTHFWEGEECSSFVVTTERDFLAAVRSGSLYASRGPRMKVCREGNTVNIECTPVSAIGAQTGSVWISGRYVCGDGLTSRSYTITERDRWVRFEITDEKGMRAWSPYYLYEPEKNEG